MGGSTPHWPVCVIPPSERKDAPAVCERFRAVWVSLLLANSSNVLFNHQLRAPRTFSCPLSLKPRAHHPEPLALSPMPTVSSHKPCGKSFLPCDVSPELSVWRSAPSGPSLEPCAFSLGPRATSPEPRAFCGAPVAEALGPQSWAWPLNPVPCAARPKAGARGLGGPVARAEDPKPSFEFEAMRPEPASPAASRLNLKP